MCEICGRPLTVLNHALGAQKCRRCENGTSPEAKLADEAADARKHLEPFASLDDVMRTPWSRFLAKSGGLLVAVNFVALIGMAVTANGYGGSDCWQLAYVSPA